MKRYQKPMKLRKSKCPACHERGLIAIGVEPDHPVIENNIVVVCEICGTRSLLNSNTFDKDDLPQGIVPVIAE